ncbi:MAG: response regulator [Desulfamplus sp.]|nr:response regulator [Desulfamplus sp.]
MKVLVVDDDLIVIKSCCKVLEAEGIEIESANTVELGEALLLNKAFDLMLTDIKMPGQDGFEMIKCAKQIRPDMPILMMTGYLTSDTISNIRRLGVKNYISKPFTPEELIKSVKTALNSFT